MSGAYRIFKAIVQTEPTLSLEISSGAHTYRGVVATLNEYYIILVMEKNQKVMIPMDKITAVVTKDEDDGTA